MHLEKNIKNKNELTKSNLGETKTFSLNDWIQDYRLRTRNTLVSNPMNVTTILGFLPFALAFCHFVSDKTKADYKTEPFFSKNLPIFVNFKPKLNYETLHYIYASNLKNRVSTQNFLFGQPQFIAQFKSCKSPVGFTNSDKNITDLSLQFYILPSGNFSSQNQKSNRNLDELPSYVQGLRNTSQVEDTSLNPFSQTVSLEKVDRPQISEEASNLSSEKSFTNDLQTEENKNKNFITLKTTSTFVTNQSLTNQLLKNPLNFTNKLSLVKSSPVEEIPFSQGVSLKNPFFKQRVDYYKTVEQLDAELEILFLEKNIPLSAEIDDDFEDLLLEKNIPLSAEIDDDFEDLLLETESANSLETEKDSVLASFSQQNREMDDDFVLETILQTLEKETLSDDVSSFRLMSGYNYPDTTSDTLEWYYKQNSFFRNLLSPRFQPDHSTNISSINKYSLKIQKLPSFLVETKNIIVKSRDQNRVLYTGPSLLLDSQKAMDWKIGQSKGISLRSWFHKYMSPLNPLSPIRRNFIGTVGNTGDFSEFQDTALFHDVFVPREKNWGFRLAGLHNSISPSKSSWHLPVSASKFSGKTGFTRGLEIRLSKEDDPVEKKEFLPIIETRHPFFKTSSRKAHTFQGYSSLFDLGVTANPDYRFSLEFSQDPTILPELNSGRYLTAGSVFSKESRSGGVRVDNWEPLTTRSWLVISQLSFFVFSLQVFNSFVSTYGKEIVGYILNLVAALGILDEGLKQELEYWMGERDKGFRVVLESKKTFSDIVGVEKFLPELYEVIWFLRNSGRQFRLSKTLPRGVLLTGPPGTGKTLLVQALAGEAKVPVVVLSGSSLIEPGESGSTKLEMAFQEAKQVAPCIVFIDEIDTLAQKRIGIVHSPMGQDGIVDFLLEAANSSIDPTEKEFNEGKAQEDPHSLEPDQPSREQITLLTQLLIELDGIKGRDGLLVIGATNRPEVLDPALLRPGRFEKRIHVGLPTQEKRVEILQFYGNRLGYESGIPWDYLGERTVGFSAADLAALMNESAIKAILNQSTHSTQTIEHGIDRLTTSESEKYTLVKTKSRESAVFSIPSKLSIVRLAYYQAGKVLVSYFLENHPKSVFASLWPRRPTIRSLQIATNLQNSVFEFAQLSELNDRVVGSYAGKAAETLFLEKFSVRRYVHRSTLGVEDLFFAQKFIYSILEKSVLYSKKSKIQKLISLYPNKNPREFQLVPEQMDVYNELLEEIEMPPMKKTLELNTSSLKSTDQDEYEVLNAQVFYPVPWWQQETSNELEFTRKNSANWSRFYLLNPEMNERNPEWVPPDVFYHRSSSLKNVKTAFRNLQKLRKQENKTKLSEKEKSSETNSETETTRYPRQNVHFSWNDVTKITRDYPAQSLALQSFNKALVILNQNRELLDRLVVELLYQEVLRKPEIELLIKDFIKTQPSRGDIDFLDSLEKNKPVKFIQSSWGPQSRKPMPRWIDFTQL